MENLTKDSISKIRTWNNRLFKGNKDVDDLSWVKKNHEKIAKYIEKYDEVNTRKAHYSSLASVFREVLDEPKLQKLYATIATQLNAQYNKKQEHQELSARQKKNWKSFDQILSIRDTLEKNKHKSHTAYRNYLILALNTLTPPLRGNIRDMPINAPRDDGNWLELPPNGNAQYHINKDKVSKKLGKDVIELTPEATNVLRQSLKDWPRTYVLGNDSIPVSTYQQILRKQIKVGINNMRSAYITEWSKKKRTIAQQKELAKSMRHSQASQQLNYNKFIQEVEAEDEDEDDEKPVDVAVPDMERKYQDDEGEIKPSEPLKPRIIRVKPPRRPVIYVEEKLPDIELEPTGFDRAEWAKLYAQKNRTRLKAYFKQYFLANRDRILRKKLIMEYNTGNTIQPKQDTLTKYKIKFNVNTKKYE